jgi:serine/threonine protein phosphatase 1
LSYDCGDYHFVHAGVRPGVALDKQTEDDQLWIRDQFLNAGDVFDGRVIVHGHTPTREPRS